MVTGMACIYLDYNATTPVDPRVRQAMAPFLEATYGNPSSVHRIGREARFLLDDFRWRMASLCGCKPSEVVFTSGGTESNNLAVFGTARKLRDNGHHLITSQVEHHAVLHCMDYLEAREGFAVTRLPVDASGRVDPEDLRRALRPDTILVSIMAANNETGVLQPVAELGSICRERGVPFHTDAVQWLGKEPFTSIEQFHADLVSGCAHKLHGPKGAGVLYIRSPLLPDPILFGGGHESERRAGTENLAAIAGLVTAMELFVREPVFNRARLEPLRKRLEDGLARLEGVELYGLEAPRLCNTTSISLANSDSTALLAALDLEEICVSSGSACASGSLQPSHVLQAMGVPHPHARAMIRFSLGRENQSDEIDTVLERIPEIIRRVQSRESLLNKL